MSSQNKTSNDNAILVHSSNSNSSKKSFSTDSEEELKLAEYFQNTDFTKPNEIKENSISRKLELLEKLKEERKEISIDNLYSY